MARSIATVRSAEILGFGTIPYEQTAAGLDFKIPEPFEGDKGYVLKVRF